ncbi:MAG: tetratricopeptide repeat protein [Candidatus Omnitrophica bacterium]|nr:tetratricopeptide repeat protein [Candidatus Omnitrophota bacterium]
MAYFQKRDFEHAISEFEKLIKEFPDGTQELQAAFYLANSLYNIDRYEDALSIFKMIEKKGSEEFTMLARYQIGWCYYNMRKEAEAVLEFTKFLKDYPQSEMADNARFWFGGYYRSKGRYDKAKEYFSSILTDYPSSDVAGDALFELALTLNDEGKAEEAISHLIELAEKFPGSNFEKAAYKKIAKLKGANSDYDSAIKYYRLALTNENNESNAQLQYEIAESFEKKGELLEATQEYLKVPYLYSKGVFWSIRSQLKCALAFERLEKWDEAKLVYEKLAGMDVEESKFAKERLEWLRWRGTK